MSWAIGRHGIAGVHNEVQDGGVGAGRIRAASPQAEGAAARLPFLEEFADIVRHAGGEASQRVELRGVGQADLCHRLPARLGHSPPRQKRHKRKNGRCGPCRGRSAPVPGREYPFPR